MANFLQTYDPFENWLSDFFWGSKGPKRRGREKEGETDLMVAWAPAVDVYEDTDAFKIHAELPGLKKEDVKVNVHDGVLSIRGERKFQDEEKKDNYYRIERSYGVFARSFTLPSSVDAEKIDAGMKEGVLEISIPKRPEAKPKQIDIKLH